MEVKVEVYKEKATEQFKALLLDQVKWLAEKCWPSNWEHNLKKLNGIIEAGKKMQVTTASTFSEAEIEEIATKLIPFRVLEMNAELQALLIQALENKGVHHEVFAK